MLLKSSTSTSREDVWPTSLPSPTAVPVLLPVLFLGPSYDKRRRYSIVSCYFSQPKQKPVDLSPTADRKSPSNAMNRLHWQILGSDWTPSQLKSNIKSPQPITNELTSNQQTAVSLHEETIAEMKRDNRITCVKTIPSCPVGKS